MSRTRHPSIPRAGAVLRGRRGIAAIEFALFAPVAILLMLVTADMITYLRVRLTLDQTASSIASVVSQYAQLFDGDFVDLFASTQTIAGSTPVIGANGRTILSGIVNTGSGPTIAWQQSSSGSGAFASKFGTVGSAPTLPDSFAVPGGSTVIAAEVFTKITPWLFSVNLMPASAGVEQRAYAIVQPRVATLATITPGTRP